MIRRLRVPSPLGQILMKFILFCARSVRLSDRNVSDFIIDHEKPECSIPTTLHVSHVRPPLIRKVTNGLKSRISYTGSYGESHKKLVASCPNIFKRQNELLVFLIDFRIIIKQEC